MADQNDLYELLTQLKQLDENQIEELIILLNIDRSHLSGREAPASKKATEMLRFLEPQVEGLQRLRASLDALLNPQGLDDPDSLPDCPYQGLSAFKEDKSDFFFGRETFIDDDFQDGNFVGQGLVRLVETKALVAVVGASGSGKSSLVFAGLLPRLRRSGNWLIESLRPEKQPFFRLATALMHQLEPDLGPVEQIAKANALAETIQKYGLANVASQILQEYSGKQLLLIVDQFEELYTQCSAEERDRFIDVILEGINKAVGLKVVLTLRADFCGQAYAYRPLADALHGADLKLGPMKRKELRRAIEKPAELMQVRFEEGLTDWLLDDVEREAGNLPLLEFALTELWKMQRERSLIYQAYVKLGGVARALATHANTVYARLSQEDQKRAQRIFVQLVRPGDGTEDTRRVANRSEVGVENWDLVTRLAGESARLVVTSRNEEVEETVEIIHEALLREWKKLGEWMNQDRSFRVWQEELRVGLRRWQQNGRKETDLLSGSLLSGAEAIRSERLSDLSLEEQEFIQLSVEAKERYAQQELDQLREQVKQQRVRTRLAATTAGLAMVALAMGGFSFWQQRQSQKTIEAIFLGTNPKEIVDTIPKLYADANSLRNELDILRNLKDSPEDWEKASLYYQQNRDRIDLLFSYYRNIIEVTNRMQSDYRQQESMIGVSEKAISELSNISLQAEQSLADILVKYRIPKLKLYLENSQYGKILTEPKDRENQYTEGALQETYRILMTESGAGADLNQDGVIRDVQEANQLPCKTLEDIRQLWLKATNGACNWYGEEPYLNESQNCREMQIDENRHTLAMLIFAFPTDSAIDRVKSCATSNKVP